MEENKELYQAAIREASRVALRYILIGNINVIQSVCVGECNATYGTKHIFSSTKIDCDLLNRELFRSRIYDYDNGKVRAFKECCIFLSGCIAEKENQGIRQEKLTWYESDMRLFRDIMSDVCFNANTINACIKRACAFLPRYICYNMKFIRSVADEIMAAPKHNLDNDALCEILKKYDENEFTYSIFKKTQDGIITQSIG